MSDETATAVRGASLLSLQTALTGVLRVVNLAVLTRLLVPAAMGVVGAAGIVYGFTQFLGTLGLNQAAPLVIPQEEARGKESLSASFLRRSLVLTSAASGLISLSLFVLSPLVFGSWGISQDLLLLLMVLTPFSAMEAFMDSFLLGRFTVRSLALSRSIFESIRLIFTVGLVVAGYGSLGVVLGWLLSEVVAVAVLSVASTRGLSPSPGSIALRPIFAFALPQLLFQTVDVTIQNTDRIILLQMTDLANLGVYDVFLRLLSMLSLVALTISGSLYPVLTRARLSSSEGQSSERFGRAVTLVVRYVVMLVLPVSIIAAVNSRLTLSVLFGLTYADFPNPSAPVAPLAFSILVLSYALWAVTYALQVSLKSMGEARYFLFSGLAIIIFEIAACYLLVSLLGLLGSALARAAYIGLLFVSTVVRMHQLDVTWYRGLAVLSAKILASALLGSIIVFMVGPLGTIQFLIWIAIAGAIYVIGLFLLRAIEAFDFRVMRSVLPRRVHPLVGRIESAYLKYLRSTRPALPDE